LGPESLTEAELLSLLVAPRTPENPAEKIAENILKKLMKHSSAEKPR